MHLMVVGLMKNGAGGSTDADVCADVDAAFAGATSSCCGSGGGGVIRKNSPGGQKSPAILVAVKIGILKFGKIYDRPART